MVVQAQLLLQIQQTQAHRYFIINQLAMLQMLLIGVQTLMVLVAHNQPTLLMLVKHSIYSTLVLQ
jgi:hypothetical protein